ncbi:hypothetical protein A2U01_0014145, partial [Trifolium medium]|nr:hypothetical protein [Trifolium medium]
AKENMRKIGLAKQLDGLYHLKPAQVSQFPSVHSVNTDSSSSSSTLWHLRYMGTLLHYFHSWF